MIYVFISKITLCFSIIPGNTAKEVQMSGMHEHGNALCGRTAYAAKVSLHPAVHGDIRTHGTKSGGVQSWPAAIFGNKLWYTTFISGYWCSVTSLYHYWIICNFWSSYFQTNCWNKSYGFKIEFRDDSLKMQ